MDNAVVTRFGAAPEKKPEPEIENKKEKEEVDYNSLEEALLGE